MVRQLVNPQYNFLRRDYWLGRADSRPLSLFRICFAALLLKNALYLIPLASIFYSDEGMVPRAQFWDDPSQLGRVHFSVLNYLPAAWMSAVFFVLWAAVCLALLLGYHTRWMVVLNYLIRESIVQRNPLHLTGADHVMTVLSFWIMFLPLADYYSVDAWLARRRVRLGVAKQSPPVAAPTIAPGTAFAFPLRIIQIQVALIYIFTSDYKAQAVRWRQGDMLYYIFQQYGYLLPSGLWLGEHGPLWLLRLLTWGALLIEAGFAVLVFLPVLQPWARACGLLAAAAMHLGIALTMAIPDFSLVMWISYILFFDPSWVAWLDGWVRRLFRLGAPPAMQPIQVSAFPFLGDPPWLRLPPRLGQASLVLVLTPILLATAWGGLENEGRLSTHPAPPMPPVLQAIDDQVQLAASWRMFAGSTTPRAGWLIAQGQFEDGRTLVLYSDGDPATGQMQRLWGPAARLRVLEQYMMASYPSAVMRAWSGYYCRLFNREQAQPAGRRLLRVDIYRHYRQTHAPDAPPNPFEDDLLWRQQCLS